MDRESGDEGTPLKEKEPNIWSTEQSARTARYNYASEKSLSHADAKLFYQRHRLETSQQEPDAIGSISRVRTTSSNANVELGLSRATSSASRRSDHGSARREQISRSGMTPGISSRVASLNNLDLLPTDFNNFENSRAGEHLDNNYDAPGFGIRSQSPVREDEFGNSAMDTSDIAPEMRAICTNIKRVQEIRQKYTGLSLQGPNDNPKDQAGWEIYPPPPQPVWDEVKNRPRSLTSGTNSLANSKIIAPDLAQSSSSLQALTSPVTGGAIQQVPYSPVKRRRKQGQDIGEDFDMGELLPLPEEERDVTFRLDDSSVYQVYESLRGDEPEAPMVKVPTLRDFYSDLEYVIAVSSDGPSKSFAFRELDILEGKFNLYFLVNQYEETAICKRVPHRDFYNVRKVDTHVHHSACMNQKHLLRFIKSKMKKSPDEIVLFRDGKQLSLKEVFESINLTAYDLSIDTLDMHVCHPHIFCLFSSHVADVGDRRIRTLSIDLTNLT